MVALVLCGAALAKDMPVYQKGTLVDVTVQDAVRGTLISDGLAVPIPGKVYLFQIQLGDPMVFSEYKAGKLSHQPEWIVDDPIELRFEKDTKMFLKRPDGKELEVVVVKRSRTAQ